MLYRSIQNSVGAIVSSPTPWYVSAYTGGTGTASASLTYNSDGSITYETYLDDSGLTSYGSFNWLYPTTAGIGSSYYIKITTTSGAATTNDASSWVRLSVSRTLTKSGTSGSSSVYFKVQIATDSAGSNIIYTSTNNICAYTHIAV